MCMGILIECVCAPHLCSGFVGWKRAWDSLELELEMVVSTTWVLRLEPGPLGKAAVLMTAEPSLQPP